MVMRLSSDHRLGCFCTIGNLRKYFSTASMLLNPIVIDTDCGFDDFVAISALYDESASINNDKNEFNPSSSSKVQFISTVAGIQDDPYRGSAFFRKTFPSPIMVTTGAVKNQQPVKPYPDPDWLIDYRKNLDYFIDKEDFICNEKEDNRGADIELSTFLEKQEDGSVDFMCLGPLTNMKNWLTDQSIGPLIQQKVKDVWIMGGNIPQSHGVELQNEGDAIKPEYNFAQDPPAANMVLSSPLIADKIFLLPAQSCIDIPSNDEIWMKTIDLAKSRNGLISQILNFNNRFGDFKYDPLCTFVYCNPGSHQLEELMVDVNTSTGLVSFVEDREKQPIKFVTHVDHFGGYLPWISKVVEKETLF